MKRIKKISTLIFAVVLTLSLISCSANPSAGEPTGGGGNAETVDRSGAAITLPDKINSIVVLAPSITQTVVALGLGDSIVATDNQSAGLEGIPGGLPAFDIQQPDGEQLAALQPDIIFLSSISMIEGVNPLQPLVDLGICVAQIPTSNSIEDICLDIQFLAETLGKSAEGDAMVEELQREIDEIAAIGSQIAEKKKVYFEIAAAPYAYSFGSGVFLHEMIEIIGAENILADQDGWFSVEPESVVAANPDVILTNVTYVEDPVGEILSRDGWQAVAAIENGEVYSIDNLSSSLPNQNIVVALRQMAEAVYPEHHGKEE